MSKRGAELKKELRLLEAAAIGIGTVVGSGVVKLPGVLAGIMGGAQVLAWVVAGILCIFVALCYARLSSVYPKCGGPYVYCSEAFGRPLGFIIAWAYWIGLTMAIGALAVFAADSLGLVLGIKDQHALTLIALGVVVVLAVANILGVKLSGLLQDALTFLKVAVWIAFVICGLFFVRPENVTLAGNMGKLTTAVLIAVWAYLGFEEITLPAEEMKKPERDIPLAIIITILFATVLYISVSVVAMGVIGTSQLAEAGKRGVELAARRIWGSVGGDIFSIFMVLSIAAVMNGIILANSRLLYAFARDGLISWKLAEVHEKYRTPWISVIVQSAIAALIVVLFTTVAEVLSLIDFVLLVPYVFVSATLIAQSIRGVGKDAPFKLPFEKAIAAVALLMSLAILLNFALDPSNIKAVGYGLAAIATGVPIYLFSKRK